MLPRAHRLTAKRDFERVSRGRPVPAPHLTVRAAPNGLAVARFGIVAGLKVSKRATARNLVKRRIREALRRHLPCIRTGADIVIHAKLSAVGAPYHVLASEIGSALARGGLLVRPWVDQLGKTMSTKKSPLNRAST